MRSTSRLALPLLVLSGLALPACDDHHGSHHNVTPVFSEIEPNDAVEDANDFGSLRPGDHFIIEGRISDTVLDAFDGFEFVSEQPLEVEFALRADSPSADLDLCVYDPVDDSEFCYESGSNPEFGAFLVHQPGTVFQLVVTPFEGQGTYSLEVLVHDYHALIEGAAPPLAGLVPSERSASESAIAPAATLAGQSELEPRAGERPVPFERYLEGAEPRRSQPTPSGIRAGILIEIDNQSPARVRSVAVTGDGLP